MGRGPLQILPPKRYHTRALRGSNIYGVKCRRLPKSLKVTIFPIFFPRHPERCFRYLLWPALSACDIYIVLTTNTRFSIGSTFKAQEGTVQEPIKYCGSINMSFSLSRIPPRTRWSCAAPKDSGMASSENVQPLATADRPKNIASVTFACGNLEPGSKCKAKCNKKGFEAAIRVREWFNEISMGWFTLESKVHSMHTLTQSELELTL